MVRNCGDREIEKLTSALKELINIKGKSKIICYTLNIKAGFFSETPVNIHQTTNVSGYRRLKYGNFRNLRRRDRSVTLYVYMFGD
jgi:hypothetical protein